MKDTKESVSLFERVINGLCYGLVPAIWWGLTGFLVEFHHGLPSGPSGVLFAFVLLVGSLSFFVTFFGAVFAGGEATSFGISLLGGAWLFYRPFFWAWAYPGPGPVLLAIVYIGIIACFLKITPRFILWSFRRMKGNWRNIAIGDCLGLAIAVWAGLFVFSNFEYVGGDRTTTRYIVWWFAAGALMLSAVAAMFLTHELKVGSIGTATLVAVLGGVTMSLPSVWNWVSPELEIFFAGGMLSVPVGVIFFLWPRRGGDT
ncbi:hypothetical protein HY416_01280 [Candidatus Kaiserbacteria bacterium]|nr:hypothetical protein [Candidatus Kaiserbacteria bacterium]